MIINQDHSYVSKRFDFFFLIIKNPTVWMLLKSISLFVEYYIKMLHYSLNQTRWPIQHGGAKTFQDSERARERERVALISTCCSGSVLHTELTRQAEELEWWKKREKVQDWRWRDKMFPVKKIKNTNDEIILRSQSAINTVINCICWREEKKTPQ